MSTDEDQQQDEEPERGAVVYGRGVQTALANNATAYGFSISITAAYGLVSSARGGSTGVLETLAFALAAVGAFVLVGALVALGVPSGGGLSDSGQVAMINGATDLLSVIAAVGAAAGLSRIPGFVSWPLTALGTVLVFLLVEGFDVVLARAVARRSPGEAS